MSGTSEGGKKAAAKQDMAAKGSKGGKALSADPAKKSEASRKAAAKQDMSAKGREGGRSSHGGQHE